jgi:hypothetical protein
MDSSPVLVTCTAFSTSTNQCTKWTLAPETDGSAALFRFKLGKRFVEGRAEPVGTYVMPFTQTLTRM